jgi:hypothetical protein
MQEPLEQNGAYTDTQRRVAKGNTPARNRMVAILHNAAMDLRNVATEEDTPHPTDKDLSVRTPSAQMWEEARAIASRILATCPTA